MKNKVKCIKNSRNSNKNLSNNSHDKKDNGDYNSDSGRVGDEIMSDGVGKAKSNDGFVEDLNDVVNEGYDSSNNVHGVEVNDDDEEVVKKVNVSSQKSRSNDTNNRFKSSRKSLVDIVNSNMEVKWNLTVCGQVIGCSMGFMKLAGHKKIPVWVKMWNVPNGGLGVLKGISAFAVSDGKLRYNDDVYGKGLDDKEEIDVEDNEINTSNEQASEGSRKTKEKDNKHQEGFATKEIEENEDVIEEECVKGSIVLRNEVERVRILQKSQENGQNRTNTDTGTEEHIKSQENAIKGQQESTLVQPMSTPYKDKNPKNPKFLKSVPQRKPNCKNHKRTVKTGQTRTRERKREYKSRENAIKGQQKSTLGQPKSTPYKDKNPKNPKFLKSVPQRKPNCKNGP
ncbi:hypothetical protein Tco_1532689 [Tanacetum coccineum]